MWNAHGCCSVARVKRCSTVGVHKHIEATAVCVCTCVRSKKIDLQWHILRLCQITQDECKYTWYWFGATYWCSCVWFYMHLLFTWLVKYVYVYLAKWPLNVRNWGDCTHFAVDQLISMYSFASNYEMSISFKYVRLAHYQLTTRLNAKYEQCNASTPSLALNNLPFH